MTAQRNAMFLHLGGPFDGAFMPVEVDGQGVPVEMNTPMSFPLNDLLINPVDTPSNTQIIHTYERDTDITDDGVYFVFRYRGTDTIGDLSRAA